MKDLAKEIAEEKPMEGKVNLYWLGGASFIIRSSKSIIGIDLYLSNACMQKDGSFKRLVPAPLQPEDISLDYLIATHNHGDHLDVGFLEKFIHPGNVTKLIGPTSVMEVVKKIGIKSNRIMVLNRGENLDLDMVKIAAVFADHGQDAPDCIGVIIKIGNARIYFTSDSRYRPDFPNLVDLGGAIDVLIVPINGKYGNPDPKDASYITAWVMPRMVIPSHFWIFAEHGGDPGFFLECCRDISPNTKIVIPAISEKIVI